MAESSILARSNITACGRCRRRKQKCDQRLPQCRSCERANVECVGIDAITKRHIPRSYVHSLEEQVAYLEKKLNDNCVGSSPSVISELGEETRNSRARQVMVHVAPNLGIEVSSGLSFTSCLLRELYRTESTSDGFIDGGSNNNAFSLPKQLESSPVTLPEPAVAEHLCKVFFELANFSTPILHEPSFRSQLTRLTHPDVADTKETFFAFVVYAIALLTLQKHDATSVSTSLCERYFGAALRNLDSSGLPPGVEGVQALLLIALYSYLHPRSFNPSRIISMAMSLAVGMSLHVDPPPGKTVNALALDTRRRTFWVAYSMDRTVGTVLRRPFAISDGAINVSFPSAVDDEFITPEGITDGPIGKKAFSLHYFRYRQLQSEIHTVLYERPPLGFSAPDIPSWQNNMQKRVAAWFAAKPSPISSSDSSSPPSNIAPPEVLSLAYHQAIISLYRPSPAAPRPGDAALVILAQSAAEFIQLYRRLHRENKLRLFWQAVQNLFAAGTALLHCYTYSAAVRVETVMPLRRLESNIHACSAVLWAMAERFPAARGKRDAFDVFSATALDALSEANGEASAEVTGVEMPLHGGQGVLEAMVDSNSLSPVDLTSWTTNLDMGADTSQDTFLRNLSMDGAAFRDEIVFVPWV